MREERVDVVIVGSGFGGSTAALRLSEKGYRVAVLEAGRRFDEDSLPSSSWDIRRFLWAPALRCFGLQRITLLRNVVVLAGAGVGGGSLNYANTLYEPPDSFYQDPQWADITDWKTELAPFYDQAKRMLGVASYNQTTPADEVLRSVAVQMGVGDTYRPTPVGVYLGEPGVTTPDPYFGGVGPDRTGCVHCGECMTGCRRGAKNTLLQNYLFLAERAGAVVNPLTTVTDIAPLDNGQVRIRTRRTGGRRRTDFVADHVVLAAGTLGTQKLLHRMRATGAFPNLSPRLGELTRTNSEAIIGARAFNTDTDYSAGVAITSSIHPDEHTHIEPCRYGKGSNAMGLLSTLLVDGGPKRARRWLLAAARRPGAALRNLSPRRWSEESIIALVMQSRDNSIRLTRRRFGNGLTSEQGHGEPNPTWIPTGHDAVRRIADEIDGVALGGWNDVFNIPMTAHILGGAPIGATREDGVIDPYHRLHGYPTIHVTDGAAVSANLGVNPSLTITAQAERAFALWPNKGEPDARPESGTVYRPVAPELPTQPVVPADAPGALRFG